MTTKIVASTKGNEQRKDEWNNIDEIGLQYHMKQWESPKNSTESFEHFIKDEFARSKQVIDLGCGSGAATAYFAGNHKQIEFVGLDYSEELISIGNQIARDKKIDNLTFSQGDWFNLSPREGCDGVISLQTLSWLPEYQTPLAEIFNKINPQWIALSSLFYEGDITCWIEVEEHTRERKCFYNVYSIPAIKRFCESHGYSVSKSTPFEINIDLDKPDNIDILGTYTKHALTNDAKGFERIQISGPLLMNWHMLLIEKI